MFGFVILYKMFILCHLYFVVVVEGLSVISMNKLVGSEIIMLCFSSLLSRLQVGLMRNGHLLAEAPPDAVMKQHSATVSKALGDTQRKGWVLSGFYQ